MNKEVNFRFEFVSFSIRICFEFRDSNFLSEINTALTTKRRTTS